MIIHAFDPDWTDPDGPFGPIIRKYIPGPEPFDEDEEVDGGQHDQEWYWPNEYSIAA